ncbi:hypothetical protein [Helicobacter pylori]|uniref:hypothetical protein n=1 Tax=Helicobacter pylori TaxID=210 RepID=UPI0012AC62E4|nr:hypothetical protein [Helicobacter pylori]
MIMYSSGLLLANDLPFTARRVARYFIYGVDSLQIIHPFSKLKPTSRQGVSFVRASP